MEGIESKKSNEQGQQKETEKPLKGIALDFKNLREASSSVRKEMFLESQYLPAREAIDVIVDKLDYKADDTRIYDAKIRLVRIFQKLSEQHGWEEFDDINFSEVLKELQEKEKGIRIKPAKTGGDYQE